MSEISNEYLTKFKELIKCDTVSSTKFYNEKKAKDFHDLLRNTFPNVFYKCRIKEIDGSLIIEMIGKRSSAPTLFICHFDTAEINGDWSHDPLGAVCEDGKIYGRGTLDAKGNLFALLESFEELIKEGYIPSQDFYIASVCDKEGEDTAINKIYSYFKNNSVYFSYIMDEGGYVINSPLKGLTGDYAMVGLGEKASATLKIVSLAKGGHTNVPIKESALTRLVYFAEEFDGDDVFRRSIHKSLHSTFNNLSKDMNGFNKVIFGASRLFNPFIKGILKKEPLANSLIQSSMSFITIHGSDCENTIASEAYAICNLRIGLNDSLEKCLKKINSIARDYKLKVEVIKQNDLSYVTSSNSYQYVEVEDAIKEVFNAPTVPFISSATTDSRVMERLTGNCFRFVPFKVTYDQLSRIHGLDENIDIDSLELAVNFYKKLIKN